MCKPHINCLGYNRLLICRISQQQTGIVKILASMRLPVLYTQVLQIIFTIRVLEYFVCNNQLKPLSTSNFFTFLNFLSQGMNNICVGGIELLVF